MPRRHQPSERRLPLRQLPPEHPYSASPQSSNPVSSGWVLPLFSVEISLAYPSLHTQPDSYSHAYLSLHTQLTISPTQTLQCGVGSILLSRRNLSLCV